MQRDSLTQVRAETKIWCVVSKLWFGLTPRCRGCGAQVQPGALSCRAGFTRKVLAKMRYGW